VLCCAVLFCVVLLFGAPQRPSARRWAQDSLKLIRQHKEIGAVVKSLSNRVMPRMSPDTFRSSTGLLRLSAHTGGQLSFKPKQSLGYGQSTSAMWFSNPMADVLCVATQPLVGCRQSTRSGDGSLLLPPPSLGLQVHCSRRGLALRRSPGSVQGASE